MNELPAWITNLIGKLSLENEALRQTASSLQQEIERLTSEASDTSDEASETVES